MLLTKRWGDTKNANGNAGTQKGGAGGSNFQWASGIKKKNREISFNKGRPRNEKTGHR